MDRQQIESWLHPGFRGAFVAIGAARDLVWTSGVLPPQAPNFRATLSEELTDYAVGLMATAMTFLTSEGDRKLAREAFEKAGVALESVVRRGEKTPRNAFLAVLAAAGYILAEHNAMAAVLIERFREERSGSASLFAELVTRRFDNARDRIRKHHAFRGAPADELDVPSIITRALEINYHDSVASVLAFFATGENSDLQAAHVRLTHGCNVASEWQFVESWWLHRLTDLMLADFSRRSLHRAVPRSANEKLSELRSSFIEAAGGKTRSEVDLWPSQMAVVDLVFDASDLVVALPTSAGKTRIAELCMLPALAAGANVVYVSPLRALSAQVEHGLRELFSRVDSKIGVSREYDFGGSGFADRRIVVMTPERLDFALRYDEKFLSKTALVIFDEAHLVGCVPRELTYELLIDRVRRERQPGERRIVCLSALLADSDATAYADWLRGEDNDAIARESHWQPSRLVTGTVRWKKDHARLDLEVQGQKTFVEHLVNTVDGLKRRRRRFPDGDRELFLATLAALISREETLLVYFPTASHITGMIEEALKLESEGYITLPHTDGALVSDIDRSVLDEWLGQEHPVSRALSRGIAVHFRSLPPPVLAISERFMRDRAASVIFASPTVSKGLNISASTVLFRSLRRYDKNAGPGRLISAEEFINVSGRAGRAFVDSTGKIVFQIGIGKPGIVRQRETDWKQLLRRRSERRLRSGLVDLILQLVEKLGGPEQVDIDFLTEHVNVDRTLTDVELRPDEENDYDKTVDEIDRALQTVLGDADMSEAEVAAFLDQVLTGSLFAQTLERERAEIRAILTGVVHGRALGIVKRYPHHQRCDAYRAGLAPRLSIRFSAMVEEFGPAVREIEAAAERNLLEDGNLLDLARICTAILEFPTYRPEEKLRFDNALPIVSAWMSGTSMGTIGKMHPEAAAFVETAVCGLATWGYESLRRAVLGDVESVSTAASIISAGVPSLAAATLLREGLASRTLAAAIGGIIPATVSPVPRALRSWMRINLHEVHAVVADSLPTFSAFWDFFGVRRADDEGATVAAVALIGNAPPDGATVFVFLESGRLQVTDRTLRPFAASPRVNHDRRVVTARWSAADNLVHFAKPVVL